MLPASTGGAKTGKPPIMGKRMRSPEETSMDAVETIASRLPRRKNARKKSGTLKMMRKYPEFSAVRYSRRTERPLIPPGANLLGVTKIWMASALMIPV